MRLTNQLKEAIVRAIMQDVPKPDCSKRHETVQAALVKAMSPACRKVYKSLFNPKKVFRTTFAGTLYNGTAYDTREVIVGDAPSGLLSELLKPYDAEDAKYAQAKRNLQQAVMACTTTKQFKAAFPEFEKYAPTENQPTKNLPAMANVVADLSKLGWPKGEKEANNVRG